MKCRPLDLEPYQEIVVLTGAGVSVASGLRPYRGPGGRWEEEDTVRMAHPEAFEEEPAAVWRWWGGFREQVEKAQPNPAHRSLAQLETLCVGKRNFTLITQNVDGLHQRAGSRNVVELHGALLRTRCSSSRCDVEPYVDTEPHAEAVPTCECCSAPLRPDIVLFNEPIPATAGWLAKRVLRECDLFLAVGTSGTVTPAANYAQWAAYAGARTILVNLESMDPPNPAFQEQILGPAEDLLPRLL